MNREDFVRLFDISLLHEVFEKIDRNHSGQITFDDLESLMDEIGIRTSSTSIHDMFTELDRNSNGSVSFIEFYNRFKFVPHANIERVGKVWASVGGIDWGLDHAAFILPDLDRLVNPKSKEFIKFLTVGGICTIVSRTLTAPLERLKLQAQTEGLASSMISELRMIVKNEGWKGLFAGNWTNCLRIFPTIAIGCYAYVHIVNYFGLKNGAQNPETATRDFLIRLGAGATGGMLASFITYPLDIIRTRLTLPNQGISSPLESSHFPRIFARSKMLNVGRDIVHNEGFKGLFRGSAAAVMSIGPFILVQNSMFNVLKTFAQEELGCKPTPNMLLTCGAVSGLLAQTAVYPLDIVRRRIQLSIVDTGISTLSSLKEIAASEGIKGLYQGILPTALKVAPAVAISLTVRDLIRPYFT
jgi:solute carrier family 25 phosphate transporter 23/24/25/41